MTLRDMMAADAAAPPAEDRLTLIRNKGRELLDKILEVGNLADRSKSLTKDINEIKHRRLPDMMIEAGIDHVGLPGGGRNLPAYDVVLQPYYKANIAAEWDDEKKGRAFALLEQRGYEEVIKRRFTVDVGMDDAETAVAVRDALLNLGVTFEEARAVPWKTLTALVREETENGTPFSPAELETLGATVGHVAELKERRE